MSVYIGNGYGQFSLVFKLAGDPEDMVVTCGFKDLSSGATAPSLAAQVVTDFTAASRPWVTATSGTQWTFGGCKLYVMRGGDLLYGESLTNLVGTLTISTPPSNCAVLVKKQSGVSGRRNRGRMYLPLFNLATSNVDSLGQITPGSVTSRQASWTAFHVAVTASGMPPYILHNTSEIAPRQCTGFLVDSKIATQRRRLRN